MTTKTTDRTTVPLKPGDTVRYDNERWTVKNRLSTGQVWLRSTESTDEALTWESAVTLTE